MADGDALLQQLLETFQSEARDHLDALGTLLVSLEREEDQEERLRLLETIFRRMHTLKGAAHAVNLAGPAMLCQELEELLSRLKRGEIALDLSLFDRLHAGVDAIVGLIGPGIEAALPRGEESASPAPHPGGTPAGAPGREAAGNGRGGQAQGGEPPQPRPKGEAPAKPSLADDTVRIPTKLLESLLLQAEELASTRLAASVLVEEAAAAAEQGLEAVERGARALELARESVREAPDGPAARLALLVEEGGKADRAAQGRLQALKKRAERHLWGLKTLTDPLLEDMKRLHLVPFSSLALPFGKLVRDLARELDKEAELGLSGGELELDRRILAELKEPLLHILRNMLDHGIERPAERVGCGKPPRGRIELKVRLQDANRAEVVVRDDGRGIDLAQVKREALRLELAPEEALERMPDGEALQLIFESGLSTSPLITTVSGRGVGLAIVRESLERLGGHVTVASRPREWTEFRLHLPLSFSTMTALLLETAGRPCLIPAGSVEQSVRVPLSAIVPVENRETVLLGGEVVPLLNLAALLEMPRLEADPEGMQPVVVVNAMGRKIAFAVDRVVGVQEILVKPLGPQLSRVRNVAGATVLGDGRVVPILNLSDLLRSALQGGTAGVAAQPPLRQQRKRLSVLVAEDSVTSRTLLKNILESSGYLVRTAIDGADALSQLKNEGCDLVISDVEMPRMDGFELTRALRADARWESLPVVLVTGLESRGDRERGIDVGANAYLVKSSFDQSGLIEIIERLT